MNYPYIMHFKKSHKNLLVLGHSLIPTKDLLLLFLVTTGKYLMFIFSVLLIISFIVLEIHCFLFTVLRDK